MIPAVAPPVAPPAQGAKRTDPILPVAEEAFFAILATLDAVSPAQAMPGPDVRAETLNTADAPADLQQETASTGVLVLAALPMPAFAPPDPVAAPPSGQHPHPNGQHPVPASATAIPTPPVTMPPPTLLTEATLPLPDAVPAPVTPNPDDPLTTEKPVAASPTDRPATQPHAAGLAGSSTPMPKHTAPPSGQSLPISRALPAPQASGDPQQSATPETVETASPAARVTTPTPADPRAPVPAPAARPLGPYTDRTDPLPPPVYLEDAALTPPPPPPPPAPPGPSGPTTAPTPTLATQVAQELHAIAARAEDGSVTVQLQPEDLGRLQFHITRTAEGLHIHLAVDQPATLDLLRRHGTDLLGDLRLDGFAGTTLSFAGNGPGDDRPAPPPDPPPEAEPAPRIASFLPPSPGARTSGTLDLRL